MKVKLIKDVVEDGRLRTTNRHGKFIPWIAGTIILMSDTSAKKYIDKGIAEQAPDDAVVYGTKTDEEMDAEANARETGTEANARLEKAAAKAAKEAKAAAKAAEA